MLTTTLKYFIYITVVFIILGGSWIFTEVAPLPSRQYKYDYIQATLSNLTKDAIEWKRQIKTKFVQSSWDMYSKFTNQPSQLELTFSAMDFLTRVLLNNARPFISYLSSAEERASVCKAFPKGKEPKSLHSNTWFLELKYCRPYTAPEEMIIVPDNYIDKETLIRDRKLVLFRSIILNKKFLANIYYESSHKGKWRFDPKRELSLSVVQNAFRDQRDTINLTLKPKDIFRLKKARDQSIRDGIISKRSNTEVSADLAVNDKHLSRVKLKLKGDWIDHVASDTWSLKIKLKDRASYKGMREFSFQSERTRYGVAEYIFNRMLKDFGIVVPKYFQVNLKINGGESFPMDVEERWSDLLYEANSRRPSLSFSIDERELFDQWQKNIEEGGGSVNGSDFILDTIFNPSYFQSFRAKRPVKSLDRNQLSIYRTGIGYLRGLRKGDHNPEDIFDIKTFAMYYAALVWWNTKHSFVPHNHTLYFNPLLQKFEPIGFDFNISLRSIGSSMLYSPYLMFLNKDQPCPKEFHPLCPIIRSYTRLGESSVFWQEFARAIEKIKDDFINGDLESKIKDWASDVLLEQGSPAYIKQKKLVKTIRHIPYPLLRKRIVELSQIDYSSLPLKEPLSASYQPRVVGSEEHWGRIVRPAHVFASKGCGGTCLDILNLTDQSLSLDEIHINGVEIGYAESNKQIQPGKTKRVPLPASKWKDDSFLLRVSRSHFFWWISAKPYSDPITKKIPASLSKLSIPETIVPNHLNKTIEVKRGVYVVNKSISIPAEWSLKLYPGVELLLCDACSINISGRLTANGTEKDPIRLSPQKKYWNGMFIDNRDQVLKIDNMVISNIKLSSFNRNGSDGAVVILGGSIDVSNLSISSIQAEDAINLSDVKGRIKTINIQGSTSDALDIDFSKLEITDINVRDAGGDAIDLSYSTASIVKSDLQNIGDKAISVGEQSKIKVDKLVVKNSDTGVAVKDGSSVQISNSHIENCSIGIHAFNKKQSFAGGYATLNNVTYSNCKNNIISDGMSKIDGK